MRVVPLLVAAVVITGAPPAFAQSGEPALGAPALNETLASDLSAPVVDSGWSADRMERATVTEEPQDEGLADLALAIAAFDVRTPADAAGLTPKPAESFEAVSGDPTVGPLRFNGRLFFKKPGGGDYTCSAQFIAPRVVLTAAHCVRDSETGAWYSDLVFALQYHNGKAAKQYRSVCVSTKRGWVKANPEARLDRRWDYAMMLVPADTLNGFYDFTLNWRGLYQKAYKIGYPGGIERGRIIQLDAGPLFFDERRPGLVAIRHGNPKHRQGSSGGAWVANFSKAMNPGNNRLVSVTSASNDKTPDISVGPYFDGNFEDMFRYVARGCKN